MTTTDQTTPGAEPILTVTWDTVVGHQRVRDEDGDYVTEPVSLGDQVALVLANMLREEMEREMRSDLREIVRGVADDVKAAAREEATRRVEEALAGEIRQTNRYGEPRGETTTLRDLIRADVQEFLAEPLRARDGFGSDRERKGGFRELVQEQVNAALRKELQAEITAARAQVAQVVRDNAAALIGDAVKGATR